MKKLIALALATAMALTMGACGKSAASSNSNSSSTAPTASTGGNSENSSSSVIYGYTCMDMTNQFHIAMRDAIKAKVQANGGMLIDFDGANDQTKQNNGIEDMITKGIKILFLNPVDSKGVKPALEACQKAGVKVIVVDSGVADTNLTETYISSNNYQAGQLCGEEIKKLYPEGAKICLIDNPLAQSVVQRVSGLEDALKGSKSTIVGRKSYTSMNAALGDMEDLLQAHPDTNVFWGLNDDFGLMAVGVVKSANLQDQVKVLCVDGSPAGKKSVAAGDLFGSAAQSPVSIGNKAVECALTLLDGGKLEKSYAIDTQLVTKDNVEQAGTDSWK
ncbi:sugar ABC transporter substrate-binding protein [Caproicibacter sp.]|uniref:sugar ABC transporter substrate-binding protein n=1 Tax=Caproicibacter sp. TaxID=2814884 RepID=UPI00398978C5